MKITCFDEDLMVDDLVGSSEFEVRQFCKNTGVPIKEWLHLQYKKNKAVEI
jgi:hypothetical protein